MNPELAIRLCGCCARPLRNNHCECMDCEHLPCCHGDCLRYAAFCSTWTDVARLIRGVHPMQLFGARLRGAKVIGRK